MELLHIDWARYIDSTSGKYHQINVLIFFYIVDVDLFRDPSFSAYVSYKLTFQW